MSVMVRRAVLLAALIGAELAGARAARAEEAAAAPKPWYEEVTIDGFLSISYSHNFNRPSSHLNAYRVFDFDDNSIKVDVVELDAQRPATKPGDGGFRADVALGGSIPRVTAAQGMFRESLAAPGEDIDLQQAFASWVAPVGSGLRLDAGKFITHHGAEVIEGYDGWNDNATRSLLFGFAIPFTHTGVRASYVFSPRVSATAMIVNGWDLATDNNASKSVGGQLVLTPAAALTVYLSGMVGAERNDSESDLRSLADVVAALKASPRLTVSVNADYGQEDGVPTGASAPAEWYGAAGYVRWQATEHLALIARGEGFDDRDGVRTGTSQTLDELTLTPELRIAPRCIVRGDIRTDWSTRSVFPKENGFSDQQTTFLASVIAWF